ncbi:hypothetical protein DXG03_008089 [Asterophora parasitica]|uniref:Deacetylase sirtuin-type domain-containing protein n=1 Tax=Asterophora parasitica TaxID=117018 RepID=A0A9P7KE95_9AGAR|nr:hypothetical protein DXG03_008089 [Asterophora parasitica]
MTATLRLEDLSSDAHTRRTLTDLSLSVAKSKKIVVITGAGISCSSGIPDFRSSDGLYALVKQKYPDVVMKGRDLFDASLFRDATSTAVFYTFISKLKQSIDAASPTPTHHFIRTLDSKKKLLRSYTQNIDGLEEQVGLLGSSSSEAKTNGKGKTKIKTKDVRSVQLHGDIHSVRCMSCSAEYPCTDDHISMFLEGTPPDCPECASRLEARVARSARPTRVGSLRPAIVLYDEPHPLGDEIGTIQSSDLLRRPDMLIIMGTSLKVHGLRKMVKEFAKTVHASAPSSSTSTANSWQGKVIFVNKTAPASEWNGIIDYHVEGDTDSWVAKVVEDWKKMRPADWEVQQTLVAADGDVSMSGGFKTIKDLFTPKGKGKGRKPFPGEENIHPGFADMILSTPDAVTRKAKATGPPISKRGQAASHYSNIESSPSKRRVSPIKGVLKDDERKLLFTESTNNRNQTADDDDIFDLSMQSIEVKPKVKATKTTAAKTRPSTRTRVKKSVKEAAKPRSTVGKAGERSRQSR